MPDMNSHAELSRLKRENILMRAALKEATTFLNQMARNLETPARLELFANRAMYATDCRVMAARLRSER